MRENARVINSLHTNAAVLYRDWLAARLCTLSPQGAEDPALQLVGRAQGIAVVAPVYGDQKFLKDEMEPLQTWRHAELAAKK